MLRKLSKPTNCAPTWKLHCYFKRMYDMFAECTTADLHASRCYLSSDKP